MLIWKVVITFHGLCQQYKPKPISGYIRNCSLHLVGRESSTPVGCCAQLMPQYSLLLYIIIICFGVSVIFAHCGVDVHSIGGID